ncbi:MULTISPECIES: hypothetical protein [unclassified Streptomyces]|uniref:hypothetical protein n=1 Tax=unclassified Streptomyces TaxID=2593676 RepID=UPI000B838292|nr:MULTISPECIES: hypothetical protein [unclassified Streptomyces]MYS20621.1 hypothetical protein [Streptomyces sp. SID4948]
MRPHCGVVVFAGTYTALGEVERSDTKDTVRADKARAERGYQQAVASGRCAPPHARWHGWLG